MYEIVGTDQISHTQSMVAKRGSRSYPYVKKSFKTKCSRIPIDPAILAATGHRFIATKICFKMPTHGSEARNWRPETGGQKLEARNWRPETGDFLWPKLLINIYKTCIFYTGSNYSQLKLMYIHKRGTCHSDIVSGRLVHCSLQWSMDQSINFKHFNLRGK